MFGKQIILKMKVVHAESNKQTSKQASIKSKSLKSREVSDRFTFFWQG